MPDTLTTNQLVAHVSDLLSRAALSARMGQAFNGKRDYNEVFGYHTNPDFNLYWDWYRRGGLAKRIIDLPCDATWRHDPEILDDENPHSENEFEFAWSQLNTRLSLVARLHRADLLQSVGHYSVMLLGTRDGDQLGMPLRDGQFTRPEDLLYVQVLNESHAVISEWEMDGKNERYGLPKMYTVSLGQNAATAATSMTRTVLVHHSRILHFAEGCIEDDVFGTPKLEAVLNLLMDLLKVSGGGAEMYWLNAINGVVASMREGWTFTPDDEKQLTDEMENFAHQLARTILAKGADIQRMGVQTADPTGNYDTLIEQIAGTVGIPKRILTGSERGELASTQDRTNWAESIMTRQSRHAEPTMLRPFIGRLIDLGILPQPTNGKYWVEWKNLLELNDQEKANLALTRAQAAAAFVGPMGDVPAVYAPSEFREDMGKDAVMPAEAQASIDDMRQNEPPLNEQNPQVQDQFAQTKKAA